MRVLARFISRGRLDQILARLSPARRISEVSFSTGTFGLISKPPHFIEPKITCPPQRDMIRALRAMIAERAARARRRRRCHDALGNTSRSRFRADTVEQHLMAARNARVCLSPRRGRRWHQACAGAASVSQARSAPRRRRRSYRHSECIQPDLAARQLRISGIPHWREIIGHKSPSITGDSQDVIHDSRARTASQTRRFGLLSHYRRRSRRLALSAGTSALSILFSPIYFYLMRVTNIGSPSSLASASMFTFRRMRSLGPNVHQPLVGYPLGRTRPAHCATSISGLRHESFTSRRADSTIKPFRADELRFWFRARGRLRDFERLAALSATPLYRHSQIGAPVATFDTRRNE